MHPIKKLCAKERIKIKHFAEQLKDPSASAAYIYQVICGYRDPSPQLTLEIERVWGIPRHELRPDVYPK